MTQTIEFSDDEKEIIIKWTKSRSSNCHKISVKGGVYYLIGDNQYFVNSGKEEAEFEDFIERLMRVGFIELEKYNKEGKPVYKLKKAAYDYVDSITDKKE